MATIDYKEKYEQALEKVRVMLGTGDYTRESLEYVFPELKEGEDERIRENIIATIHLYYGEPLEDEAKEMIAWLEKQGEHANFRNKIQIGDKVTRNEDGVLVNLSQLNRVAKKDEKQSEQKPVDKVEPKFKVGQTIKKEGFNLGFTIVKIEDGFYYNDMGDYFPFTDQDNWKLVEQKPAWSEEDGTYSDHIITAIKLYYTDDKGKENPWREELLRWFKSLKDRVQPQPKQEWSEEDREMINLLIAIFRVSYPNGVYKANPIDTIDMKSVSSSEIIDWLKSLKDRVQPQNRWKPSEHQLTALGAFCYKFKYSEALKSLYDDLKKL